MAPTASSTLRLGALRELLVQRDAEVATLTAEIARRDAVARYNQALAVAGAILADRPDLLEHGALAADMIVRGVPYGEVKARMLEMGSRH